MMRKLCCVDLCWKYILNSTLVFLYLALSVASWVDFCLAFLSGLKAHLKSCFTTSCWIFTAQSGKAVSCFLVKFSQILGLILKYGLEVTVFCWSHRELRSIFEFLSSWKVFVPRNASYLCYSSIHYEGTKLIAKETCWTIKKTLAFQAV